MMAFAPPDDDARQYLAGRLLAWYGRNARRLPWRAGPGETPEPYHVWLSEIMLQQTTVSTVIPYFRDFLAKWPTVHDLAAADRDAVLHAWQGLGYYARARNLHKCAVTVSRDYGGAFPPRAAELQRLPGIGPYTAAAIAAIAFGEPVGVLDGNIERVASRLWANERPPGEVKDQLRQAVEAITPVEAPGDFAQALMDLGATVCTPKRPACLLCPIAEVCAGYQQGLAAELPVKKAKPEKPTRRGIAFWACRADGAVLIRKRPESGLLGGMMEIPSSTWREGPVPDLADAAQEAPVSADWQLLSGAVRHTFTHFHLELKVAVGRVQPANAVAGTWVPVDQLPDYALPTAMKKVVRFALKKAGS